MQAPHLDFIRSFERLGELPGHVSVPSDQHCNELNTNQYVMCWWNVPDNAVRTFQIPKTGILGPS